MIQGVLHISSYHEYGVCQMPTKLQRVIQVHLLLGDGGLMIGCTVP